MRSVGATDRAEGLSPDVLRWAQTADRHAVACRDVRHAWPDDDEARKWVETNHNFRKVWERRFVCMHGCGVSKVQRKDFLTRKLTATYDYPKTEDGQRSLYLLPPGCSALTPDLVFELTQMSAAGSTPTTLTSVPDKRPARKPAAKGTPATGKPPRAKPRAADPGGGGSRQRVKKAS